MEHNVTTVGSITLTPRYVVCETCVLSCDEFGIQHTRTMRRRSELFHIPKGNLDELQAALDESISWFKQTTRQLDALTVSSCRPLKSVNIADRGSHNDYGVICSNGENPEWGDFSIYHHIVKDSLRLVSPLNIFVHVDVALGSIGDFHCRAARWLRRLKRSKVISHFGFMSPREIANRISKYRLLYIKLSDTVEAFVSVGGRLLSTAVVPNYGSIIPRKLSVDGYEDPFTGICQVHGACNTGLFGANAIEARLNLRGEADFHSQPASCPEERILSGYAADLIRTINYIHQIDSITLGGRLVDDRKMRRPNFEDVIDVDLPRQIWARLIDLLQNDRRHRFLPRAERIFKQPSDGSEEAHISGDFVSAASCAFPVAFGGLVYAAQMYQCPREVRIVPFGPKG